METWHRNRLNAGQAELVEAWLPGVRLVADLSWNLLDTAVLEVAGAGEMADGQRRYVVKAAGPSDHHIGREIDAHESWISVWSRQNRAPRLVHADRSRNVLVTEYFRPAVSDFCRLAAQQWRSHPYLEEVFFEGYGVDLRAGDFWNVALLHEAVSTAAWAFQVGDHKFEEQGHRMLRDALANF